jgi:hypothetical protein
MRDMAEVTRRASLSSRRSAAIVEAGDQAPIDIAPFSNAIMKGRTHPEV